MSRSILFALLVALVLPLSANAQLSVQLSMERDTLLLYESIPVVASVRNFSGRTIELGDQGETPWLAFLINDEASATISQVGKRPVFAGVKIPPGQVVSQTCNLLPCYDLRQRGTFTIRAVVDNGGVRALSSPVTFTIMNGREIWKQTIGLPVATGETNEGYRTYSLIMRHAGRADMLYVGVQDEPHELIYGMIPLGSSLALGEPNAKIDAAGHAHVLYRSGPRSYSYAEIDPEAKVLKLFVYSDLLSVPRLATSEDGSVAVLGGEQTYPRVERVMTDRDLNPPTPLAKPKKKWWWPFGPGKSAATSKRSTVLTNP